MYNKPRGFHFKRWKAPSKSLTAVDIHIDEELIHRKRGAVDNSYIFREKEFKALKGAIPEEISEFCNMSDYNIQLQNDPPFLFASSPTDVAKMINAVAGMEIIDKIIKVANRRHRKAKAEIQVLSDMAEEKMAVMRKNRVFPKLRKDLLSVKDDVDYVGLLESDIACLEEHKELLSLVNAKLSFGSERVELLSDKMYGLKSINKTIENVVYALTELKEAKETLSQKIIALPPAKEKRLKQCIQNLKEMDVEFESFSCKIQGLLNYADELSSLSKKMKSDEKYLALQTQELEAVKKEAGNCPLCGNKFKR